MSIGGLASLAATGLAIAAALLLPDLVLIGRRLFSVRRKRSGHYAAMVLALSVCLAGSGPHPLTWALVLIVALLSLAWHLSYAYFGDVLRPESLLLFVKPDHFVDSVQAGFEDVRRLAPVVAAVGVAVTATVLLVLAAPRLGPAGSALSGLAGFGVLAAICLRAVAWTKQTGAYPTIAMPAVIGALHALALALKWQVLDRLSPPHGRSGAMTYVRATPDEEPITVAVIMGESIAPARMSLFGGPAGTTPGLKRRAREEGAFRLFAKLGFAAGVASNASVAGFLGATPFAARVPGSRTLFELARAQDFATHYFSAQRRSPLDLVGGVGAVDHVATQETCAERLAAGKDDVLVDLVREARAAPRALFFVYQRVNHAPYHNHQVGEPEPHHAYPGGRREVLHNYDIGLRSYDRNVDALLAAFAERPGATFVFVTSDHNELLGEDGLWGHNISGELRSALVPMLLFTNRPDHPVARAFAAQEWPSAHAVARLALSAMGVDAQAAGHDGATFQVSNALPFGRAGYISVRPGPGAAEFEVTECDRSGREIGRKVERIDPPGSDEAAASAAPAASDPASTEPQRRPGPKRRRRPGALERLRAWRAAGTPTPPAS